MKTTITSNEALGIIKILGNGAILSKTGAITIPYYLDSPPSYSLTKEDFESRDEEFFRAFKHMGNNTYIHKQDIFLRKGFNSNVIKGDSFIQEGERKFFNNMTYNDHNCILSFSLAGLKSLESSYIKNPLKYDENLTNYDMQRLVMFLEEIKSVLTIINNLPGTKLTQLTEVDIKYYLFNFLNGFNDDDGIRDNIFADTLLIGEKKGAFFALCEVEYLPDKLTTSIKDETLPKANSTLYSGMLEQIGVHLKCSHIVNQIWHFDEYYKADLEKSVRVHGQHKGFGKEIEREYNLLNELQEDIINKGNVVCKTHFNVYILEEESHFNKSVDVVKSVFKSKGIKYYIPIGDGLKQIYLGNIIGCVNKLNPLYWYKSDLMSSLCLTLHYSTFRNDKEGIFFNDRLYNCPLRVDFWDSPQGKKLPARNIIFMAGTGGGKSVTAENLVQQNIENGIKQIVVEFGKSFYQLTQLYPEISMHIDYDGETPLGINPFKIKSNEKISSDKINTLVNIIFKFWRSPELTNDSKQAVSLRTLLINYYENIIDNHSFPDFYMYVKDNFYNLAEELDIETDYFDYNSFCHITKEFLKGGFYENVCKDSPLGAEINEKDFIVFELTKIKKDPFLVDIIMSILVDVIETKLLSDRSVKGFLLFDEYAEVQTMGNNSENFHSTVAFAFQKLRKENSAVGVILQSPAQLIDNPLSKGIISNTQIIVVLPTTEVVYNSIVEIFQVNNESHVQLMKSIYNDFQSSEPYSEAFIRYMDTTAIVVRLKLSREKFYAFQTDGEKWNALQKETKVLGSLEKAITNIIKKENHEKSFNFNL